MINIEELLIKKGKGKYDIVSYDKLFEYLNNDPVNIAKREISNTLISAKINRELTNAIKKSSDSSDRLGIIGLIISISLLMVGYSQIIVTGFGVKSFYLLGNIIIVGIFILLYLLIFKKGKK